MENTVIMQAAHIEELQKKVNELTAENKLLQKSLKEVLGLAIMHEVPKEMLQVVLEPLSPKIDPSFPG